MARDLVGRAAAALVLLCALAPVASAAPPPGEAARIAGLLAPAAGASGGAAGALVRPADATASVVAVGAATPYEPASSMKTIVAVANERTAGRDYTATVQKAFRYPSAPNIGSRPGFETSVSPNICPVAQDELDPGNLRNQPGGDATRTPVTFQAAQTAMLEDSDNPLTRALLLEAGGLPALEATTQAAGMSATSLGQDLVGCGRSGGKSNVTTLEDMSRLYAAIDTGGLLTAGQRTHLYGTMLAGPGLGTQRLVDVFTAVAAEVGASPATRQWFLDRAFYAFKGGSYTLVCAGADQPAECAGRGAGSAAEVRANTGLQRIPLRDPATGTERTITYTVGAHSTRVCALAEAACGAAVQDATVGAYAESLRSVVRDSLLSRQFPADRLPVASFAVPDAAAAGVPVTLDASGSSDAEGAIARFDWAFGDGSAGTGQSVTHTFAAPGTYVVELGVTDGVGKTDLARRMVVVGPAPAPADPGPTGSGGGGGGGSPAPQPPAAPPVVRPPAAPTLTATAARRVKRGRALAVRVTVDRATRVTARVQRSAAGRREGRRCVAPSRARRGRRCTRIVDVARVARSVPAGAATLRIATRRLRPGAYRVLVSAPGAPARTLRVTVRR